MILCLHSSFLDAPHPITAEECYAPGRLLADVEAAKAGAPQPPLCENPGLGFPHLSCGLQKGQGPHHTESSFTQILGAQSIFAELSGCLLSSAIGEGNAPSSPTLPPHFPSPQCHPQPGPLSPRSPLI